MSQNFTEAQLESAFTELIGNEGYPHHLGNTLNRAEDEVILADDLRNFLLTKYKTENLTESEANSIILQIKTLSAFDLYESNKKFMSWLSDGFIIKREDRSQKDIYIQLVDYGEQDQNIYKFVTQLEITEVNQKRIPDGILYVNGLPLVVFEFKSATREEATIRNAYEQLTVRYKRDIPQLFIYNAFCVISDGVNNKAGSFFAPYEFYYAWRRVAGLAKDVDGIDSMFTLVQGMLHKNRLRDIICNFIFLPDSNKKDEKILCRYPQYYAARALYKNIKLAQKNTDDTSGDGKGGTYFGATGCGKSFTMLFLARLLMKDIHFSSPTIVLITDRNDLDDQLSETFTNAKGFIGDQNVISVESRNELRELLQHRESGGVFLTTIQKFSEDIELLTDRTNVICISDEAHRTQVNLDQKVKVTEAGVKKTYGFAKYLHDSLPNATYVGFTGTPIDATLNVFGDIVDAYTMTESVHDEITVPIVYEGRAAKVLLDNSKLKEIEAYYVKCAEDGANEYQIDESKKVATQMNSILGDPDVLKAIAYDFVTHYEKRIDEGATVKGKAMFVCSSRSIAYALYQEIISLRPEWTEIKAFEIDVELTEKEKKEIKPMERIKMIMTRGQDDPKEMYNELGTKDDRKELDRQFKNEKSNFKIAIVVDMWLTGFDVPFLDSMYIYKPIQQHNLIQTISRVNRKFAKKSKGLVVDYIGIKSAMNKALKQYSKIDGTNFEDIESSVVIVKDMLDLLANIFHKFDSSDYFTDKPLKQLHCLKNASEFVQLTEDLENRFMALIKRLKSAYDICCGSEVLTQSERDHIYFYLAIRSIIFKLTKGNAPDTEQMNAKVREMVKEAILSEGVEEIVKIGDGRQINIYDPDYLTKIEKIKLPNTKIKLLQQLLSKAIDEFKKINKIKAIDFSKKMKVLVDLYNDRKPDVLESQVLKDFTDEIITLYHELVKDRNSFEDLGIDLEEKAFYDILKLLCMKYKFDYPEDKLLKLSKKIKVIVDDKAKYADWNRRIDIKAELKVDLIILLAENDYPPIDKDEVYKEIFEQAENFKRYNS